MRLGDEHRTPEELMAVRMGMEEHYVADERVPFKEYYCQNFIDEYRRGRTPGSLA